MIAAQTHHEHVHGVHCFAIVSVTSVPNSPMAPMAAREPICTTPMVDTSGSGNAVCQSQGLLSMINNRTSMRRDVYEHVQCSDEDSDCVVTCTYMHV